MTRADHASRGRRLEATLDGARVAWIALPAGSGAVEDGAAHRVAVHVGPPHRLWEARGRERREGPHRRGHVVVTAAGERAAMRWDRATVFVEVALERELVEQARLTGGSRHAVDGAFAADAPVLRDRTVALVRGALARRDPLALEELVLETSVALVERRAGAACVGSRGGIAPARLRRVLERIHDALDQRHALVELAELAGTSRFHFARQFRRTTGLAPHAYVIEARVNEAARLLLGGMDVEEAALRVGMGGRAHLARHLRARLGVTPGALRSAAATSLATSACSRGEEAVFPVGEAG